MSQTGRNVWMPLAAWLVAVGLSGMEPARAQEAPAVLPPLVGASQVFSADERSGFGLRGFDPVSYFLGAGPRPGEAAYEVLFAGLAWRFAGPANQAAFLHDPEAFAPRIGGYDTEAAARGLVVEADPTIFTLTSSRLYLFRTGEARARFLSDPGLADAAERRWPALRRDLVQP